MSTKQDRDLLKTYFETGDRPTEEQFEHLIDSGINQVEDQIDVSGPNKNVGIGKINASRKLHVAGKTFVGTDSSANPQTSSALEVNAGQAHGIAVSTEGNDVFNFLDLGQPLNPNPFTITDNAGRGFRFYKNVAGGSGNGEHMRIAKNGNVGVGPIWADAQARLEVLGKSEDENSNGIIRVETADKTSGANLRMGALSGDYSWIQAHGNKPLHINKIGNDTLLNETDGNVGVGVSVPGNKLHVHNNSASDTGLRLSTGGQAGHILVSDNQGNASWESPTVVTNGLWTDVGTTGNIKNGNSGNVVIGSHPGTESVYSQLEVTGTLDQENQNGILRVQGPDRWARTNVRIGVSPDSNGLAASGYLTAHNGPLYINSNGTTILNNDSGNVGIGTDNPLSKLQVNGNTDIRGDFFIDGKSPILMRRFTNNVEMKSHHISISWPNGIPGSGAPIINRTITGFDTGIPTSTYAAAAITGHSTGKMVSQFKSSWYDANGPIAGSHDHTVDVEFQQYIFVFKKGGTWHIAADLLSLDTNEAWRIDVMFMKEGFVELNPADDWNVPLND